jgi:hypothetical protein
MVFKILLFICIIYLGFFFGKLKRIKCYLDIQKNSSRDAKKLK